MSEFFTICEYFGITPIEFFNGTVANPKLASDAISDFEQLSEEDQQLIHLNIKRLLKK